MRTETVDGISFRTVGINDVKDAYSFSALLLQSSIQVDQDLVLEVGDVEVRMRSDEAVLPPLALQVHTDVLLLAGLHHEVRPEAAGHLPDSSLLTHGSGESSLSDLKCWQVERENKLSGREGKSGVAV